MVIIRNTATIIIFDIWIEINPPPPNPTIKGNSNDSNKIPQQITFSFEII